MGTPREKDWHSRSPIIAQLPSPPLSSQDIKPRNFRYSITKIPKRGSYASPESSPFELPHSTPATSQRCCPVEVVELGEEDPGYQSELEWIHPDETEEVHSDNETNKPLISTLVPSGRNSDNEQRGSADVVARRLSMLSCDERRDDRSVADPANHDWKKVSESARGVKRSHSCTMEDGDCLDSDDRHDHGAGYQEARQRRKLTLGNESDLTMSNTPEPRRSNAGPLRASGSMGLHGATHAETMMDVDDIL